MPLFSPSPRGPARRSGFGTDALPEAADYLRGLAPRFVGATRRSLHVPMRDGERIAIDVHLPAGLGSERVPTILRMTRYYRRFDVPPALARLVGDEVFDPVNTATRRLFLSQGYAWVDVDARGSGASFGERPSPWSADEIRDGAELVDWVIEQGFSNGKVGATGVSYDGTAAEFLLVNRHPAVLAVAPRFSLFDVYADVAFPGGMHLSWFTEAWGRANAALDRNHPELMVGEVARLNAQGGRLDETLGYGALLEGVKALLEMGQVRGLLGEAVRLVLGGVAPVDGDDPGRSLLRAAIGSHARNYNVHEGAVRMNFRDDPGLSPSRPDDGVDTFSPSAYVREIDGSGAAVYGMSGWFDGGYQGAAIKRHAALSGGSHRLLLGPWSHAGIQNMSPYAERRPAAFDQAAELLRFFDHHMRGLSTGIEREAGVRYFTMGEERWKTAAAFPPPGARTLTLYLGDDRVLTASEPPSGVDTHRVDPRAGTGPRARWRTLLSPFVLADYADAEARDRRRLVYASEPLDRDLEVTGYPSVVLFVASSETDGAFFVYLEDVTPGGEVLHITEGELRALHRKTRDGVRSFRRADASLLTPGEVAEIAFELLPVSHLFRRGHRVRLALAGADRDHFRALPGEPSWAMQRGGRYPSRLELPVMGASGPAAGLGAPGG